MKNGLLLFTGFFVVFVYSSCTGRKLAIPMVKEVDRAELKYTFISSEIVGDSLEVKLQYGGGCIKPHLFDLVQTASTEQGEVVLWLLHKTLDDKCRALVKTEVKFDISSVLGKEGVTSIKLNGEKELLLSE